MHVWILRNSIETWLQSKYLIIVLHILNINNEMSKSNIKIIITWHKQWLNRNMTTIKIYCNSDQHKQWNTTVKHQTVFLSFFLSFIVHMCFVLLIVCLYVCVYECLFKTFLKEHLVHVRGVPPESFMFQGGDLTSWTVARKLQLAQCWRAAQIAASFPGTKQWGVYHREAALESRSEQIATNRTLAVHNGWIADF